MFSCTIVSTEVPKNSLLPVWSPCVCVLMMVVIGLFGDGLHPVEDHLTPARELGVDDDDARVGDEDGGVAAAEGIAVRGARAGDDEEVVFDLLDLGGGHGGSRKSRLRRLGGSASHRHGADGDEQTEHESTFHDDLLPDVRSARLQADGQPCLPALHQRIQRTMPATPSTATCDAVRNAPGRVGDAEHHRDAALARERRHVRGAAAAFGDDAGHARQDVAERRPADTRHQHVARRDAPDLALAVDDDGPSRSPSRRRPDDR